MAISFVDSFDGGTTATIPAHQVGDLIIITAYAGSGTAPTLGSGFTSLGTAANGTAVSARVGYRIATATTTTTGTWTGAAFIWGVIYRGTGTPGTPTSATGTSASVGYPALTLAQSGTSWVFRPSGALNATNSNSATLTGYTQRRGGNQISNFDSNGGVASPGVGTQTVNTSGPWVAFSLEIPPAATASAGSAAGSYTWAGTSTGKRTPKASASGSYTWAGTATGKRTPKASASGAYTFSGTAAGDAPPNRGTASGGYTWAGTAAGKRTPKAGSAGSYTWSGSATGDSPANHGAASGGYGWVSGVALPGTFPVVFGGATGETAMQGTASGSYTWSGSAAGVSPALDTQSGSAAGSYTFAGTAGGVKAPEGSASGGYFPGPGDTRRLRRRRLQLGGVGA
jgi:hypothetical protein